MEMTNLVPEYLFNPMKNDKETKKNDLILECQQQVHIGT